MMVLQPDNLQVTCDLLCIPVTCYVIMFSLLLSMVCATLSLFWYFVPILGPWLTAGVAFMQEQCFLVFRIVLSV